MFSGLFMNEMLACWLACHKDMNKNEIILNLRVCDTDNSLL